MSLKKQWNVLIIISVTSSEYRLEDRFACLKVILLDKKTQEKYAQGYQSQTNRVNKTTVFFVATWVMLIAFENSHCCLFSM